MRKFRGLLAAESQQRQPDSVDFFHKILLRDACLRLCVCVCVRACACVCVRACVRACVQPLHRPKRLIRERTHAMHLASMEQINGCSFITVVHCGW